MRTCDEDEDMVTDEEEGREKIQVADLTCVA